MLKKITGRHMEVTEALRSYVEKKMARLCKYYDRLSEIEVILDEDGLGHRIEIIAKPDNHQSFVVQQSGDDMYACLDLATDKLERQLTRHKEKSRIHKGRTGASGATADVLGAQETEPTE